MKTTINSLIVIILTLTFSVVSCGQTTEKETITSKESIEPKIDYKVNKKYDKNGNLIRYDSTYTNYYSNIDKDTLMNDSIFKRFNEYFSTKDPFNNHFFDDFFKQDSYPEDDFFTKDFFRESLKQNQEMMDKMMQRMDSLKNEFFLNKFPLENTHKESKDKN